MPGTAGTLETIAQQVGLAIQPLNDRLASGQVIQLFAELGLQFPPQLLQPSFVNALTAGGNAAGALPATLTQLANAIDTDNESGILSAGVQLIQEIGAIITAIEQIGTELNSISGSLPGMNAAEVAAFAQSLASNLLSYLLISYLEQLQPGVVGAANLLGILDYVRNPGVSGDPTHPPYVTRKLQLSRLGDLFTKPDQLLQSLYQWGSPGFDGTALIPRLATSMQLLGVSSAVLVPGTPPALDSSTFSVETVLPGIKATLKTILPGGFDFTFPLGGVWSVHISATGTLAGGLAATIVPPANVTFHPTAALTAQLESDLIAQGPDATHPIIIIGQTGGSRLQTDSFTFGMGVKITWDSGSGTATAEPTIQVNIKGGKVVIDMSNADGFLASVLSGVHVEAGFDLGISWAPDTGIHITGGAQLEIDLPLHLTLGPVTLPTLYLVAGASSSGLPIEISAALGLTLGPIEASVDRVGVKGLITFPDHGGNLGPANLPSPSSLPTVWVLRLMPGSSRAAVISLSILIKANTPAFSISLWLRSFR